MAFPLQAAIQTLIQLLVCIFYHLAFVLESCEIFPMHLENVYAFICMQIKFDHADKISNLKS